MHQFNINTQWEPSPEALRNIGGGFVSSVEAARVITRNWFVFSGNPIDVRA